MKESEFVSDTFAEHDTNEINELKKSLKESLGVVSPENGKLKSRIKFISKKSSFVHLYFTLNMI